MSELSAAMVAAHPSFVTGPGGSTCEGCGQPIVESGGSLTRGWIEHIALVTQEALSIRL